MKGWITAGCIGALLLLGSPAGAQYAPAQNVIGGGLAGAGAGAALGAIAGGGRGAATGALVGGTVGAATGAFSPHRGYAYPYRGCRWIPAHHNRWGEWRPGHCAR